MTRPHGLVPPFRNPDEPPEKYQAYPRDFDMVDTPEQLAWWPLLRKPLEICEREVLPAYKQADAGALRHQDRHRKLANAARCSARLRSRSDT